MRIQAVSWEDDSIRIIDQTKLPTEFRHIYIKNLPVLWESIREMKVRGAPALGVVAALGAYLGIKDYKGNDFSTFMRSLDKAIKYIASSRPTAKNLFWALERMRICAMQNRREPVVQIKNALYKQACLIMERDKISCFNIGKHGAKLIKDGDTILTICNAGALATVGSGTALGIIYEAKRQGKRIKVFACETRPMLQGARLTTWELNKQGVGVTLICDNMAASLMQQKRIDKVITGADRICRNADTANKIGTYSLAVLSFYHKIPFYIAAPLSTFDTKIKTGKQINIEQRSAEEVKELFFKKPIATADVKVYNPAFDVTPHSLISAIITEKGVIKPPYRASIAKLFKK